MSKKHCEDVLIGGGGTGGVAAAVLDQMLACARRRGLLEVRFCHKPIAAECGGDRIRSVAFRDNI